MHGGVFANAVALPHTETPAVLFTSSLLERLDEDEAVAIFAHEVAHLEHFNPAYLRRLRWMGWAMVAAGVGIGPLLHIYAPGLEFLVWAWPFMVFACMSLLTVHRQKHETESDVRAVALTGDAEALVRGLAKLPLVPVPGMRLQPVDARDVATRIVELALGAPTGRVADIAGPTVYEMKRLVQDYLTTAGKRRLTVPVRLPGKAGKAYRDGQNLTLDGDHGTRTWEEFLAG